MSNKYAKTFLKILRESPAEQTAFESSLDDGVDASEFSTDMEVSPEEAGATSEVADALSRRNQRIINDLQGWITKIEEFLTFLNSEDPNSVQSKLANAEPDTVMDKMKQSQQTKISRVASDLASLHQNFLGFIAQSSNPRFRNV